MRISTRRSMTTLHGLRRPAGAVLFSQKRISAELFGWSSRMVKLRSHMTVTAELLSKPIPSALKHKDDLTAQAHLNADSDRGSTYFSAEFVRMKRRAYEKATYKKLDDSSYGECPYSFTG